MIEHLERQYLVLTNREKKKKLTDTQLPWDADDDIRTYFTKLNKLEEELRDEYNIKWPTSLKILQAVNEMYDSNNFDEKEMMTWEDDDNQTWVHLQTYFGELWEKNNNDTEGLRQKPQDSAKVRQMLPNKME